MRMDRQMVEQSLQESGEAVADLSRQLSASQSRAGMSQGRPAVQAWHCFSWQRLRGDICDCQQSITGS